jgi:hypothetical protein
LHQSAALGHSFAAAVGSCLIKFGAMIEIPVVARYHHRSPPPSILLFDAVLMSAFGSVW